MVRYYIKEKPIFHNDKCMTQYQIWTDYGPFWNFVLNALSFLTFGHFRDTTITAYDKDVAEKNLKEYVKFKQLGG